MEKKYELTDETTWIYGNKLTYRIRALRDFGDVKAGDLGGFVEHERNLSHNGNCWVRGLSAVYDDAVVCDNAIIDVASQVSKNAKVFGNSQVTNGAKVSDNARIYDNACVSGTVIYENAQIYGNAKACCGASIYGNKKIYDKVRVCGYVNVYGDFELSGLAMIGDNREPSTEDYNPF